MLDLAISIDTDEAASSVVETNHGRQLKAAQWPQDCEFQLVAFSPTGRTCKVIRPGHLAQDVARALTALDESEVLNGPKPDWYRRLAAYAKGATLT